MREVSAVCLALLLAAGVVVTQQQCVPGAKSYADANCTKLSNCPKNDTCECVPILNCNVSENTARGKIRMHNRERLNSECKDPKEMCCPRELIIDQRGHRTKSHQPIEYMGCGQRYRNGVGNQFTRPMSGEAHFGEFPWMVALLNITNGVEKMIGGGALIHPSVVITAAHTVHNYRTNPSLLRVRAGEWNLESTAEDIGHQQLEVFEVIVHERYNRFTMNNDIALLVLLDGITKVDSIGLLCLPSKDSVADSSTCIVSGWGADSFGQAGCFRNILKSVVLPTVSQTQCEGMFRQTRLGKNFRLDRSFMCAGGQAGVDACIGDGGGPLVCPIPGDEEFYELAGVTSWGIGCGQQNIPGAYTQVSRYREWVDQKFKKINLETEAYTRSFYYG